MASLDMISGSDVFKNSNQISMCQKSLMLSMLSKICVVLGLCVCGGKTLARL